MPRSYARGADVYLLCANGVGFCEGISIEDGERVCRAPSCDVIQHDARRGATSYTQPDIGAHVRQEWRVMTCHNREGNACGQTVVCSRFRFAKRAEGRGKYERMEKRAVYMEA
jgi:hypothetical protein